MNDRYRAINLLKHRERGFSIPMALKPLMKKYLLYIIAICVCIYLNSRAGNGTLFLIIIGIFIGTMIRDMDWLKTLKRSWPFTEKVTDWDKVKEIAHKES